MLIYEYKCAKCEYILELRMELKKMKDKVICPECEAKMNRLYSAPGVIFKGEGFYVNDYKKD